MSKREERKKVKNTRGVKKSKFKRIVEKEMRYLLLK